MAIFSGAAALISGAISAVSTFIGGLGAIGSFVLKAAVGLGTSLLAQSLAGKPQDPTFSINGTLQGGGDLSRSFLLGRAMTAGSLAWVNTWGRDGDTPNAFLTQVIPVADLPVRGLADVWVNGEKVTLGALSERGYAINEYPDCLWVKFYDGTQTTADGFLFNSASNNNRWWNPDRIGRGVAYVIVTARVSQNMFSGVPSFKFVVDGLRLYDPSRDSTVGGDGPQRFADPSTWGGDGDFLPAVQIYNLLRGLSFNGQWFYGLQNMPAARLPAANWIAQIEKNRAGIQEAGGIVNTFRSGGEVQVQAPLTSALEALLTACHGKISEVGGVYTLHCGAPDAPVIAFTDDDILSTEEQEFTPFLGLADTINGVSATYPSPADGWVVKTAPPLYRPDLEANDGNRRLMADVDLTFVPYAEQVQRLMKSALEEARRFRRHTIVLPPKFWAYATPCAVFSWTSERNGYVNKLMRLDGAVDRGNLDVMIDITEVDPADHGWTSSQEFKPPVDGAVGVIRPAPQAIVDWYAEPATVKDSVGRDRRPAIRLTWDNSEGRLDDVIGIEYEVRLQASLDRVHEGRTDQPQAGSLLISQGLLPLEAYVVRARYIPRGDRPVLWSGFIPVTTPNVLLTDKDVYVDLDLTGIDGALGWLRDGVRTAKDAINGLLAGQLELSTQAFTQSQEIRRELSVSLGSARAEYREKIEVGLTATQAVATRLETLEVSFGAATAQLSDDIEIIANANAALSGRVQSLSAALGGNNASINVAWSAVATPAGYAARYGIQAAVNDGKYRAASFLMDVPANPAAPSRIIMRAGQVVMVSDDDATVARPFVFQNGVLTLDQVKVNSLDALSAKLGNVDISNANIGSLIVGTSNIEAGAISVVETNQLTGAVPSSGAGITRDITITHGTSLVGVEITVGGGYQFSGSATYTAEIVSVTDGTVLLSWVLSSDGFSGVGSLGNSVIHYPPSSRSSTTYRFRIYPGVGSTSGRVSSPGITAKVFKR
jgi:hypothetical protein